MMFALKLVAAVPIVATICGCFLAILVGNETEAERQAYANAYDRRDREYDEFLKSMGPAPEGDRQ